MSAINQSFLTPIAHVLLRSFLPRDRQLRIPGSNRRHRPHRESPEARFIVHMAATLIVFLILTTTVWLVEMTIHAMQSFFPLSEDSLLLLHKLELLLLYADVIMTGTLLLNAMSRYVITTLRGHP